MPRRAHDLIVAAHALRTERIVLTFDAKPASETCPE